jgi:hypothetical protein
MPEDRWINLPRPVSKKYGVLNTMKLPNPCLLCAALLVVLLMTAGCSAPAIPGISPATTVPTTQPTVSATCGMENCHGVAIQCGPKPVDFCTAVFEEGDQCRQYASCQDVAGSCQPVYESRFEKCKNCVEMCASQYSTSPMLMADCQQKC